MEWVEIAAPSVDEAREIALDRLGVTASEIELEVLAEPTKALFGLRRTDARIRARVKPTAPPAKVDRNDRRRGQRGQLVCNLGLDRDHSEITVRIRCDNR